jgi:hypothetical protein
VTKQVRAEEPRREEPDKLLRIAGLVNGYHNDGTKLSAAETLAAIADVLGDPFDFSSSAVVVGADQQLIARVLRLAHWEPGDDLQALRTRLACIGAAAVDFLLALPDPGVGADQQEICICAAVRLEDDGYIIRGHRHHNCLQTAVERQRATEPYSRPITPVQGFITSRNRFVDRKEGLRLQLAAGIESVSPDGYRGDILFSEDLY